MHKNNNLKPRWCIGLGCAALLIALFVLRPVDPKPEPAVATPSQPATWVLPPTKPSLPIQVDARSPASVRKLNALLQQPLPEADADLAQRSAHLNTQLTDLGHSLNLPLSTLPDKSAGDQPDQRAAALRQRLNTLREHRTARQP